MKMAFGTDESARSDQEKTHKMIESAERKVDRLTAALNERPARDLDEAMYQMTHRDRE